MTTPNSKSVKQALKSQSIEVKRSVIQNGRLTVTVAQNDGEKALEILKSLGLTQQWNKYAESQEIKACVVGCLGVTEFTALVL